MSEKITIINNKTEALDIARKCQKTPFNKKHVIQKVDNSAWDNFSLAKQVLSKEWQFSDEAIQNTLSYLYDKLHHVCYLVCISDGQKHMYKISHTQSATDMYNALLENLRNNTNPELTDKQRSTIQKTLASPFRVMQCIVKPFKDTESEPETNEYLRLMDGMDLPNGVFILNLTDAVILKENREHPFPYVVGKADLGKYAFKEHIPILSISGAKGYSDIVIPNYDDVFIALGKDIGSSKFTTNWSDKKIEKAVFRGGPTGCGYTPETNQRLHLATMNYPTLLDAQITVKEGSTTIDSNTVKVDPKYGVGMLSTGIKPGSFLTMADQSKFKYIVHVDGNVNAYRLLTSMMTGSLILRVESEYTSWVDHLIKPNVHYISVKADLTNLIKKIKFCKANDDKCKEIAKNGMEFAKKALEPNFVKTAFQKILWAVGSRMKGVARKTVKKTDTNKKAKEEIPEDIQNAEVDIEEQEEPEEPELEQIKATIVEKQPEEKQPKEPVKIMKIVKVVKPKQKKAEEKQLEQQQPEQKKTEPKQKTERKMTVSQIAKKMETRRKCIQKYRLGLTKKSRK